MKRRELNLLDLKENDPGMLGHHSLGNLVSAKGPLSVDLTGNVIAAP